MFTRLISVMFRYIFLMLLVSACSEQPPGLRSLGPDSTILAFGNSLTYGTGANEQDSYPAQLSRLLNIKVINAGNPGEVSRDGLKRLPALLQQHQPDLLILCHGGNDMIRKMNAAQTQKNLEQMIELAKAKNIDVILLGVPKPGLFLNSAELYESVAEKFNLPIQDTILPAVLAENDYKSDPIHPNRQGYQLISEAIYKLLETNGAI